MNRLEQILAVKRSEIEQLRPQAGSLRRKAVERNDFREFGATLKNKTGRLCVVAEIKKASPSAGTIVESFEPVEIAQSYDERGASAISVLTDHQFFQGSLDHLIDVRRSTSLPILRKDFVIDEIQITEAAAAGADAILLIVAALDQKRLVDFSATAAMYQLDVLVEVHTLEEMERALDADAAIIGINNRDLTTFAVDLSVTERLSEEVPNDVVLVSESGIKTMADVARVKACGANAILVGEAFMRGELSLELIR